MQSIEQNTGNKTHLPLPVRVLQERRICWAHGLSPSHAALIARLHYGEVTQ